MDTSKLLASLVLVVVMVSSASALDCAPCNNVTCVPFLSDCELGQRVCSCCLECRVPLGGTCGPFSPECESPLVCLTSEGGFVGRPPLTNTATGTCISPNDMPAPPALPQRRALRSLFPEALE